MRITVITVCHNARKTIRETVKSVLEQEYRDVEYIVVDGASNDGTQEILEEYRPRIAQIVSEPDEGIYDAMNKAWKLASGDFVGYLHADDYFADQSCVGRIAEAATASDADVILGDVEIVSPRKTSNVVRKYSAQKFTPRWILEGDMPPYPGLYVRRSVFHRYGGFDLQFRTSADFDFVARLLHVHSLTYAMVPFTVVKMRNGGLSTRFPFGPVRTLRDVVGACKKNGIRLTPATIAAKYLRKLRQYSIFRATTVSWGARIKRHV